MCLIILRAFKSFIKKQLLAKKHLPKKTFILLSKFFIRFIKLKFLRKVLLTKKLL